MKKKVIIFTVLCAVAAIFTAVGQTQSQNPAPPPSRPLIESPTFPQESQTQTPDNSTDITGRRRYLAGPGDLLEVRVFGQPDLSSQVEIDDEGNISSLPFLEDPIPAMCRTEKDIQKSIAEAYSRYLKSPRISVRVTERRSRPPAIVFGAVRAPTRVQMMRRVHLHELLVVAGGITLNASGEIQIVHTEREMCPQDIEPQDLAESLNSTTTSTYEKAPADSSKPNGATTSSSPLVASSYSGSAPASQQANAQKPSAAGSPSNVTDKPTSFTRRPSDIGKIEIYKTGDVRQGFASDDPLIRPGDIVIVTEGQPIYITGAVIAPREIVMKDGMSLSRAIAMAGGLQKLAKSHEVHVYRQVKGKLQPEKLTFDYQAIKDGKQPDVPLFAYDIIDVRAQGTFSPDSLGMMLRGMAMGGLNGIGSSIPFRVLY
jgi:protein involved in polysaccharide export with SLBB domain